MNYSKDEREKLLEQVVKNIRSTLLSRKGTLSIDEVVSDYRHLVGQEIPYYRFNFPTLEAFLTSLSGVCKVMREGSKFVVTGIASENTQHIHEMVARQESRRCAEYLPRRPRMKLKKITKRPLVIDFPLGQLVSPVTVGFVEHPAIVWVSPDVERKKLMEELDKLNPNKLSGSVVIGTRAGTVYSEDGKLYRCEVLCGDGQGVKVQFMDFGNRETKNLGDLFALPPALATCPALAVKIYVEGVEGVADSSKNRTKVERKLDIEDLGVIVKKEPVSGNLLGSFTANGKSIKIVKFKEMNSISEVRCDFDKFLSTKEIKVI